MMRDVIRDGYERGLPVAEIARLCGMTSTAVRTMAHRTGLRHQSKAGLVSAIWEMDEDERRAAFARRAAEGARKALEGAEV